MNTFNTCCGVLLALLSSAMLSCTQTKDLAMTSPETSAKGSFVLVEQGQPRTTIVLPHKTELEKYLAINDKQAIEIIRKRLPQATDEQIKTAADGLPKHRQAEAKRVGDEELLAASELQAYVKKISGAELPIVRAGAAGELPKGQLILLGNELARANGLAKRLDEVTADGVLLEVNGGRLLLTGSRARGTLYAVYELLESFGCRWIMPGEPGELYTEQDTLATSINKIENPSHRVRYWWGTLGVTEEFKVWTLRNKGNFVRAIDDPVIQQGHALGAPLRAGAHDKDVAITINEPVRQFKKGADGKPLRDENNRVIYEMVNKDVTRLPDEYFAQVQGKLNQHIPNMANPKVWDYFAKFYRNWFIAHPNEDYVSVSAEDGVVADDRAATRNLDSGEWDWMVGAPSATDRLLFFNNRNIEAVAKDFPDRKFGFLVYANNMSPPRVEHVHSNMALVFAPLGVCPLHDVRDEKCKTNRTYRKWFEAWMSQARAVGAESYYYDYIPIGYSWNQLMICPQWPIVGKNYPWFHKLGLTGHTTQGFDDWGSSGLTYWTMIQLYWNVDQDYHDIVRDYCNIRFGKAADKMVAYYKVLEDRMNEVPDLVSNEIWGNHLVLTPEVRAKCRAILNEAQKLVDTPRARKQLAMAIAMQKSTDAFCDGIEIAREKGDFAAAATSLEKAFDVKDELNKQYANFVNAKNTERDSEVRYRPGGWLVKYRLWDQMIKNAGDSFLLPRQGKIVLDTDNVARSRGWQLPQTDVSDLRDGDVTLIPDVTFGTQREPAAYFYRFDVNIPKSFKTGKRTVLFMPSVIARAVQIWINGEPITFDHDTYKSDTWHGPATFWYDYNHQQMFDITGHLKPGQKNTIAWRIFKSYDHGGTYDRVFILADPAKE